MSGGVESLKQDTSKLVEQISQNFNIDERTTERVMAFLNTILLKRNEKWRNNFFKIQKRKADEIYKLFKEFKSNEGKDILEKVEKKILELYVER